MRRKDVDFIAKKNSKRGFTLVELIVVLVILAILAALLIPALTGYIDKARKSQAVAETRMLMQAVQIEMSTLYGSNEYAEQVSKNKSTFTVAAKDGNPAIGHGQTLGNLADRYNAIVKLSEVPSLADGTGSFFAVANYKCQLKWVVYSDGKGYYGVYCQADGTVTGYSDKEVKGYDFYKNNIGRVICDATADVTSTTETLPWTPTMVRLNLGISVN